LTVEWSSALMSHYKSLFTQAMYFPPIQTGADVRQTKQHAALSGLMLIPLLRAISFTVICSFPNISCCCCRCPLGGNFPIINACTWQGP
jgi:hypothetical protein